MATDNKPKQIMLSERASKMLNLIRDIEKAHNGLLALYGEVYYETDHDKISEALYNLQDLWLDRVYNGIRENFWHGDNEL
ncbi:MAG: hypothetical protein K2M11_01310 [Paramuribaculum sp.]|nr:hypothetical protein [Paramuribaculum sp.]